MKMSSYRYMDPHIKDKTVLALTWESHTWKDGYIIYIILRWSPCFQLMRRLLHIPPISRTGYGVSDVSDWEGDSLLQPVSIPLD